MAEKSSPNGGQGNDDPPLAVDCKPIKHPISSSHTQIWHCVKPFLNGAIAGSALQLPKYLTHSLTYFFNQKAFKVDSLMHLKLLEMEANRNRKAFFKLMPSIFLLETTYHSLQLGSFEILTRKVEAANKGMPLTLYQGIGCGLISGAIGASIGVPIHLAHTRATAANANYTSLFQALYHKAASEGIIALWKGGRYIAYSLMALNMGMLASYNPIFNYLRDSVGLSETESTLGAGAVSGSLAATCSFPYTFYGHAVRNFMKLKPGECFYISLLDIVRHSVRHNVDCTLVIMLLWYFLEVIKKTEISLKFKGLGGKENSTEGQ